MRQLTAEDGVGVNLNCNIQFLKITVPALMAILGLDGSAWPLAACDTINTKSVITCGFSW